MFAIKTYRVYHKMHPFGVIMWMTGCYRIHTVGDSFTSVFRWWHPLTWLLWLALGPGVVPTSVHYMHKYHYSGQMRWVTPFTKMEDIPKHPIFN